MPPPPPIATTTTFSPDSPHSPTYRKTMSMPLIFNFFTEGQF